MKDWLEKVVGWGTYAIIFFTPILYFGVNFFSPYTTSKTFFFYGLTEIVFVLWLYLISVKPEYRLPKKIWICFTPLLVFLGWLTIAGISGVRPELSFWSSLMRGTGLITLYHGLALSLVVASLISTKGLSSYGRSLLTWFLNGSFVLALSVWLGNEGLNLSAEFLQKSKGGGLIGNSSLAATYLIFTLFLGLFTLFISGNSRKLRIWITIILLTTISSPLFLGFSARAAVLGIVIGLVFGVLSYLSLSKRNFVRYTSVAFLVLCALVSIFTWKSFVTEDTVLHQKFTESATGNRFVFWDIAKQGLAEKPILGWGPENYSVVYQKYFDPVIFENSNTAEVWNDRAHNIFLELGVAGGYSAIFFYLLFLVSLIIGTHKAFTNSQISRLQFSILISLIVAYILQNLFVFDSLSSLLALSILTAIIFGLNGGLESRSESRKLLPSSFRPYVILFLVIFVLTSLYIFTFLPYKKVTTISEVIGLSLNKRPDHYKDLLHISPVGDGWEIGKIAEDAYLLYSKNIVSIKKDSKLLAYSKVDLGKLLEYLEVVAEKRVYDYRLYLNMSRLYHIYADLAGGVEAKDLTKRALELGFYAKTLSPNDPQVNILLRQ